MIKALFLCSALLCLDAPAAAQGKEGSTRSREPMSSAFADGAAIVGTYQQHR
ncbi:MAG TPA: hypothetical protein VMV33_02755 [Rhodocyclaceae bacterium]|nr:hypothetical protein [Rhodocyclaceae bacterium]